MGTIRYQVWGRSAQFSSYASYLALSKPVQRFQMLLFLSFFFPHRCFVPKHAIITDWNLLDVIYSGTMTFADFTIADFTFAD